MMPNMIGEYRDGIFRRRVRHVSTASTARYDIEPKDSGTIFSFGVASTVSVGLPRISSNELGLTYDLYFSTADAAGDYTIMCRDSSAGIYLALTSAGVGTPSTITPATTDAPHGIRVTAISSIVWAGEPLLNNAYTTAAKAAAAGSWTTG